MNYLNVTGSNEIIDLLQDFCCIPAEYILRFLEENLKLKQGNIALTNLVYNHVITQDDNGNCSLYGIGGTPIYNLCIFHIALELHKNEESPFHITTGKFPFDAISYAENKLYRYMICNEDGKGKLLYYKNEEQKIEDKDIQQIPVLIFLNSSRNGISELMYPEGYCIVYELHYSAGKISNLKKFERGLSNE